MKMFELIFYVLLKRNI